MGIRIAQLISEEDFENYYDLRWRILREPWNQPRGTEKDDKENDSLHVAAYEDNIIVGVGRAHFNSADEAQVRWMAVEKNYQGRGIGHLVMNVLEQKIKETGAKRIILNSRENVVPFYQKCGYHIIGEGPTVFGVIPHKKMQKVLI